LFKKNTVFGYKIIYLQKNIAECMQMYDSCNDLLISPLLDGEF